MDTIDKWLKSLRLHKYTHLFRTLTYDEMLNLEEKYLIDKEVTKGARNKMLVSIKKLNLRRERLINMMDDLNHDNISMKEALTVLKDMLITPIPAPKVNQRQLPQIESPTSLSSSSSSSSSSLPTSPSLSSSCSSPNSYTTSPTSAMSSTTTNYSASTLSTTTTMDTRQESISGCIISKNNDKHGATTIATTNMTATSGDSMTNNATLTATTKANNYLDPYELTYLFIETLEKVAHRLIESAGMEDNACHGIMTAIVDECLKHNSFTKEQKAKVASFKQHFTMEQKAKVASFKQQLRQRQHSYNHHHCNQQQNQRQQQHQQQQQQQPQYQFHRNHNHHYHYHHHHNLWNGPIQPPSLSASLSTIGSASTSDEEERQTYREYSLLGPGTTFELPCLRALAAVEKHNRRQLCFLSVFQSKSSC